MKPTNEFEHECASCNSSFIIITESSDYDEPEYCPFCGSQLDIEYPETEEDYEL